MKSLSLKRLKDSLATSQSKPLPGIGKLEHPQLKLPGLSSAKEKGLNRAKDISE